MALLILLLFHESMAEGTKQLRKDSQGKSCLQIYDRSDNNGPLRKFATYEADSSERLYFTISDYQQEVVLFGFQMAVFHHDMFVRIRDKQGNVVYAPQQLSSSGNGYITSYDQAVAGPSLAPYIQTSGGYDPFVFKPSYNGDYYIEFNPDDPLLVPATDTIKYRQIFELFDISIINGTSHRAIEGRVWSRAWDFTTQDYGNAFTADLFIYADDGIVTKVNFNGMQPYGFVVSSNSTGTRNDIDPYTNRQSVEGNMTYPQYKIFLTYPDSTVFKSGQLGLLLKGMQIKCTTSGYCFSCTTTSSGALELLLDLNHTPGYQPGSTDVLLGATVATAGQTCLPWDGLDGLGQPYRSTEEFMCIANFKRGLTHLPLYDVEGHPNGYIVEMVVPEYKKLQLYWDDTQLPEGIYQSEGCTPNLSTNEGCHNWSAPDSNTVSTTALSHPMFGNNRTINTWWYANLQVDTNYVSFPLPPPINISSDHQIKADTARLCEKSSIQLYALFGEQYAHSTHSWYIENKLISTDLAPTLSGLHHDTKVLLQMKDPVSGCLVQTDYTIEVRNVFIPNLMTPNGDDKNDRFEIVNIFPNTFLQVYNAWGGTIYQNNNYDNNWDAAGVSDGTYFYQIHSGDHCGNISGWLEVLR
ncbi:MAG: large protein [Chitinophagaceae bacterium]|nr:large protein [Chitinophagaceae bacterium]